MPVRTIHNQGQRFAIPHATQSNAPQALISLMRQISNSIAGQSPCQNGIRTVQIQDGINIGIEHEKLKGILYSFTEDPDCIVQYTPLPWKHTSMLVIHVGEELQMRSEHSGGTMFVFLQNGTTVVLTKSSRENGGTVRRTTSWTVAIQELLDNVKERLADAGRELCANGYTTHNEPLSNAGREIVSRSYTAMSLSRELDSEYPQNATPNFTDLNLKSALVV